MRRALRVLLVVLASVAALVAVAVLAGGIYVARGVDFPPLTGQHEVGKVLCEVVDESRREVFSSDPDDRRDLLLTVYYPASPAPGAEPSPCVQGKLADVVAQGTGVPKLILRSFDGHSYDEAPRAQDGAPYPVLLFSQGFAGQLPLYSSLLEEVASHGYVVVCISHPYTDLYVVYPDGRVVSMNDAGGLDLQSADRVTDLYPDRRAYLEKIQTILEVWTDDTVFALDELAELNRSHATLAGSMDLNTTGVFGHSFGGSTALDVMRRDSRIGAGVVLEGAILGDAVTQGVRQPLLMQETPTYAIRELVLAGSLQRLLESSERCYLMGIRGAGHLSFVTDVPFVAAKLNPFVRQDVGTIDPRRSYEIITRCTVQFFDQELKGIHSALLDESNITVFLNMREYPEVTLQEYSRR